MNDEGRFVMLREALPPLAAIIALTALMTTAVIMLSKVPRPPLEVRIVQDGRLEIRVIQDLPR